MSADPNAPVLEAIAALRRDLGDLRADGLATRTAIMDRIDRLQGAIAQLRADSMVNWSTADAAMRRVRGNQDEAREVYDLAQPGGEPSRYRVERRASMHGLVPAPRDRRPAARASGCCVDGPLRRKGDV
jgi:hypothetical protein